MAQHDQRFPAYKRLRRRSDFIEVYRRGRRYSGRLFVIYLLPQATSVGRLGLSVSRKVGGAVVRNRIKRLVRTYFRTHPQEFVGLTLVVEARPQAAAQMSRLERALALHLKAAYRLL